LEGQQDLRSHVNVPKDICAALAQESNGSYFTTQPMSSEENKQWRSLLARRVAKTARPHTCQKCDCVLDNDFIHSKTVCTPC
jgi:PREDICTED: similar to CG15828-PB, isoform B